MNEEKYEKMYNMLVDYEKQVHEKNQKRIKIGLKLILIIPLVFLLLLFFTGSSKIIFLVLWIVSLFLISGYLILVEYMDYKIQIKLDEINGRDESDKEEVDALIGSELINVENALKNAKQVINTRIEGLNNKTEEKSQDEEHI